MDRFELDKKFDKGERIILRHDLNERQALYQTMEDFFDTTLYDMGNREDIRNCIKNRIVTYGSRSLAAQRMNAAAFSVLEVSLFLCERITKKVIAYRSALIMTAKLLLKNGPANLIRRHKDDEMFMKLMQDFDPGFSLDDYGVFLDIMIFYCCRTGGITEQEYEDLRKAVAEELEPVFVQEENKAAEEEDEESEEEAPVFYRSRLEDPREVARFLKQYVKGQDEACENIALDVATLFIFRNAGKDLTSPMVRLLIGETSSGKTYLMQTLQKINVPVFFIDGSELTEAGYKGTNLDNALGRVLSSEEKYPVIFIDEFDTKLKPSYGMAGVDNNRPIQKNMLTLCAGTYPGLENALVYLAGAFSDLFSIKRAVAGRYHIPQKKDLLVTRQDILRYGMMNELLSRIKVFQLNPVDPAMIRDILYSGENSPLKVGKEKAKMFGITINYSDGFLEETLQDVWSDDPGIGGIRNLKMRIEEKVDAAILRSLKTNDKEITIFSREEETAGGYLDSFIEEWK